MVFALQNRAAWMLLHSVLRAFL